MILIALILWTLISILILFTSAVKIIPDIMVPIVFLPVILICVMTNLMCALITKIFP